MTLCESNPDGRPSPPTVRILLVDDHVDTLVMLSRLLSRCGYHVVPAASFSAAITAAKSGRFDLLVTDIELGDGTGWALFDALRHATPDLRAIAVTAHGMPYHRQMSDKHGFDAHLVKPMDLKHLCEAIERAVRRPASQRSGPAAVPDSRTSIA